MFVSHSLYIVSPEFIANVDDDVDHRPGLVAALILPQSRRGLRRHVEQMSLLAPNFWKPSVLCSSANAERRMSDMQSATCRRNLPSLLCPDHVVHTFRTSVHASEGCNILVPVYFVRWAFHLHAFPCSRRIIFSLAHGGVGFCHDNILAHCL